VVVKICFSHTVLFLTDLYFILLLKLVQQKQVFYQFLQLFTFVCNFVICNFITKECKAVHFFAFIVIY